MRIRAQSQRLGRSSYTLKIDNEFVTQGGHITGVAVQARFAIDERLAIIATKDGLLHVQPDTAVSDGTGFANVAAGFKYSLFRDAEAGQVFTTGLRYEIPMGEKDVLQGQGNGIFNPFISGAVAVGPVNFMAYSGFRLPVSDSDSTFYDADFHMSTPIDGWFYPTFEVNLQHVLDAGTRLAISDEGADFFNLGSSEADGTTLVTGGAGFRARISPDLDTGITYQWPITQGKGSQVFEWRITTDLIYRFNI